MRQAMSWGSTFMRLAEIMADCRSKDPNTQVGCVIVNAHKDPIAFGYNGFGAGSLETDKMWERPSKYDHVIHAEANAIGRAAKRGCSTDGCTAYVTAFPCLSCAKQLIAAGITRVVAKEVLRGWDEDHQKAVTEFERCGVRYEIWST